MEKIEFRSQSELAQYLMSGKMLKLDNGVVLHFQEGTGNPFKASCLDGTVRDMVSSWDVREYRYSVMPEWHLLPDAMPCLCHVRDIKGTCPVMAVVVRKDNGKFVDSDGDLWNYADPVPNFFVLAK